ncbi:mt-a70 family protein, putative, partial [Ichthyophthirius multifiliis]
CDIRYFDFSYIIDKIDYFDSILLNPNINDVLNVNEIVDLKVELLSDKGFLFFWIKELPIATAYEIMGKWGYEVIDQIVWVKLNQESGTMCIENKMDKYLLNSQQICMVGVRNVSSSVNLLNYKMNSINLIINSKMFKYSLSERFV